MIASAKSLTATGAYLIRQAKQLARSLFTTGMRSQVKIIDGYLLRASRAGNIANCTVIDPPGVVVTLGNDGDARGGVYALHPRDFYSTIADRPHVTFTLDTTSPAPVQFVYFPVGFTVQNNSGPGTNNNPLEESAKIWREVMHASSDRYVMARLSIRTQPDIGVPYYDILPASTPDEPRIAQLFVTVVVMNAQTVYGVGGKQSPYTGYAISSSAISALAPGYVLMREAEHGYSGWEYAACPPAAAMVGPVMIAAIPVTKQGGTGVTDWGEAAMLILGLNPLNAKGEPDGTLIRWHYLWTPAEHPQPAVHPGPWVYQPDYKPMFNETEWDEAWYYDVGQAPRENLGSRPSWTDCLSCQPDGNGVLFRFKYSTISGIPYIVNGPSHSYGVFQTAEVEAVIELYAAVDGTITAEYPSHEVFTTTGNPDSDKPHSPYQQYVVGILPLDHVKVVTPVATLMVDETLVRLNAEFTADRSRAFVAYVTHDWSGFMLNPHTDEFGFRVKSTDSEWFIKFSDVGAGFVAPVIKLMDFHEENVLSSTLGSYKTWDASCLAAVYSRDEIAVLVFESWQAADTYGAGTQTKIVIINVRDGTFRVTPDIGYYHAKTLACREMPVLSVVQQEVRDKDEKVIQKAVLLVSGARSQRVLISRDGGDTWDYLLDFPAPIGGSFYLGNTLTLTVKPGDAQVIR